MHQVRTQKRLFCADFILKNPIVYQDRLGTDISSGNAENVCACLHQMSNTLSDRPSRKSHPRGAPRSARAAASAATAAAAGNDKYTMHSDTPGSFGPNCSSVVGDASPASGGSVRASGLALPLVLHDVAE
eukprot:COSAG06_NODE_516_length_14818_cov_18.077926_14_plen_130_part_00